MWEYLNEGKKKGISDGYICSHRSPWYSQEKRKAAPIVCTYMSRSSSTEEHAFRFIFNKSNATMTNVYLGLYPTKHLQRLLVADPSLLIKIWKCLNKISTEDLLSEGRVYGGGLCKLEPKELANVPVPFLKELSVEQESKQKVFAFSQAAAE